ncbi:phage tail tape measure protein [Paenirhodobacter populi]|uniref:phage tail tape measure protein n=1 Tax=Paenirhodobacter populi TaxID=2306993 RepID=UPI000FE4030B|nr:phage tail tape measure protein [Sinirhodobacter populi]RWR09707.1 phage tail tape measure protein [Sinirhodobacter populi]
MALKDLFFSIFAEDKTGPAFNSVNSQLSKVGKQFAGLGMAASGLAVPLGLGLKSAISYASDWEAALNRSTPLLRATSDEMEALEDLSLKLGATTKFSAGEAAEGIEMLAKNGLSASQVLGGALKGSLETAIVGGAGLSDAADVVTDAMASFGVRAEEVDRVVGGMAGTMSKSKMQFDDYRLALGQAGGVAGGLGVTMEDFNAVLASTASLFASGSDAGTSYKTFLTSLVPKSGPAAEAMDELGLKFFDATGNMLGMAEVAGQLQAALGDLSDEAATTALRDIFGRDAMRTAIGLARVGRDGVLEMQEAIANTDASELAAARMMGAAGATEEWRSAVEGFGIAVARSGLLDAFTSLVKTGTEFMNWLSGLDPVFLRGGAAAAVFVTALAPLGLAIGGIAVAVGTLGVPLTAAIAGVAALTGVVAAFWPEIKSAYEWITAIPQSVKDVTTVLIGLSNPLALLGVGVSDFGEAFSRVFANIKETVIATVTAVTDWLGNKFNGLMDSLGAKVEWVEGKFAWLYDKVVGNSWVPDLVEEIGLSFGKLDGNMVKVTDDATGSVNDSFKDLWSDVSGGMKSMVTDGELTFTGFMETLNSVGERYADKIVGNVFDTLSEGIGNALSSAFSGASTGGSASSGLGGMLSGLGSWASGLLGFDTGGAFTVTGRAGMDRNVAAVRLSEGEEVNVTKRGQSTGATVNVYIQTQDVNSFRSSKAQIGRQLSAAVNAGLRGA